MLKKLFTHLKQHSSTLYLSFGLLCFQHFGWALNKGAMPADVQSNSDSFETVVAWVLKIAGFGAVAYGCMSFARNKLQGQAVDTIVYIILGLGACLFGVGWWMGKQSQISGFAF